MAKLYQIKFSEPSEKLEGAQQTVREGEIILLENLFRFAGANLKDVVKINECLDVVVQLQNMADDQDHINLTKSDLESLKLGISTSAGKRPPIWMDLVALWKQFEKPEEVVA